MIVIFVKNVLQLKKMLKVMFLHIIVKNNLSVVDATLHSNIKEICTCCTKIYKTNNYQAHIPHPTWSNIRTGA